MARRKPWRLIPGFNNGEKYMDYNIELNSKDETIEVNASCLLNQDIRKKILLAVARRLKTSDFSKVLIDLTESTFNPSEMMTGALELTDYLRSIGIKPHVKFAFIYSDAESHRKYFENVAQSFGFNIQYFKSRKEAEAWLNQ